MSSHLVRNVCVPFLPAIVCLAVPGTFAGQALADGESPVAAQKPAATLVSDSEEAVIAQADVIEQVEALLAAAEGKKKSDGEGDKAAARPARIPMKPLNGWTPTETVRSPRRNSTPR